VSALRLALLVALATLVVRAAPARAEAPLDLTSPAAAVSWLLAPRAAPPPEPAAPSDGALHRLVLRSLYVGYRSLLASQDIQACTFSPSCSRFSEQAVARYGLLDGVLLSADRLLRDHPFAVGHYPKDPENGRLLDEPAHYRPVAR
jgi:putative component of membrane protein insertase Oxa1/YidC/SpoIIIJ protein YidD